LNDCEVIVTDDLPYDEGHARRLRWPGRRLPTATPSLDSLLRWVRAIALFGILAFIAVGVAVIAVRQENNDRVNAIIRTRAQSRIATCQAIADMRVKHNHLVGDVLGEQQEIVNGTGVTAAGAAFLQRWVATFQTDLLLVPDCSDPAQVSTLFTSTSSP
jgi:hypothetical protein